MSTGMEIALEDAVRRLPPGDRRAGPDAAPDRSQELKAPETDRHVHVVGRGVVRGDRGAEHVQARVEQGGMRLVRCRVRELRLLHLHETEALVLAAPELTDPAERLAVVQPDPGQALVELGDGDGLAAALAPGGLVVARVAAAVAFAAPYPRGRVTLPGLRPIVVDCTAPQLDRRRALRCGRRPASCFGRSRTGRSRRSSTRTAKWPASI